jgi:predicted nuclease of restriction endonuclease-like (RecB) superfamily
MTTAQSLPDYPAFLAALKARILDARISAARAINHELVLLYWDIGRGIVEKQQTAGWGDAVVERLAADLRTEFPDMRGFSIPNLWRMKQLYLVHTSTEFLAQAAREIGPSPEGTAPANFLSQRVREMVAAVPWGHHANMLAKLTDSAARLYYLRATARFGWSRNVLLNQIKAGAYERAVTEKKTHNFPLALPEYLAEQADEMLKSRYNLEILGIREMNI